MSETIGFVGLGNMGLPMAINLARAGFAVRAWNRTASKGRELLELGATIAEWPRAAASAGEIVVSMVSDDWALEDVTMSPDGILEGLPSGGIHVSMSSVSPAAARRLAGEHERRGCAFVSAPVFGRPDAAAERHLYICVSGPAEAKERVRRVLDVLGQAVFDFGPDAGAANVVKLAGNFLIASMMESVAEAFVLAEKNGIERERVFEMLGQSLFDCPVYKNYGALIAREAFTPARFKLTLGLKDINLLLETAAASRMPMPLASLLRDRFYAALAKGREGMDWAALALGAIEDAGLARDGGTRGYTPAP